MTQAAAESYGSAAIPEAQHHVMLDQPLAFVAAVRAQLAAWPGVFGEVSDDEVMSRNFVFEQVIPYLIDNGIPISGPMNEWPYDWFDQARSVSDRPEQMTRLLTDPKFATMLEARLGFKHHTSGEYQAALEAVENILEEIDRSLSP